MSSAILKTIEQDAKLLPRYENYIGGKWVPPVNGEYFTNLTPISGENYCEAAHSTAEDIELALDAAHAAREEWGKTSPAVRAALLNKIADRMEEHLPRLALVESFDKGKPIREAMAADIPLAIDHFRYFAGAVRVQEGTISEIDEDTIAYHYHEPYGVVGQIIPWNFPLLMAAWKLAPALAAGNCVVLKPAEQTPVSIMVLMEVIGDLLPPGVINVVNGFGPEAGAALSTNSRIAKVAFTGETSTGQIIMHAAADSLIPVTLELGGKSPNIFFGDIFDKEDGLMEKALEGFAMFALNQGECCTCPSRALVHESIYDQFMERAAERVKQMIVGNPLEVSTMIGAQASKEQMDKILSYINIGRKEGANVIIGGEQARLEGDLAGGYYVNPTILEGTNAMRVFREEIFGPVVGVTKFKDMDEALAIANDSEYGLSSAVWSRDLTTSYKASRGIEAGRVWVNSYHLYPAHAAFGGYKKSGIGRETHKMMLDHYQQVKCVITSHHQSPLGFF